MQELKKILKELEEFTFEAEVYNEDFEGADINNLLCLGDVRDVLRKYMNNDWIPTKERMPTKEECERDNIRFLISVGVDCCYSTEVARCTWVEANNIDGTDGSYSEFWIDQFPHIYRPSHRLIAAWKILELPEPYIPR